MFDVHLFKMTISSHSRTSSMLDAAPTAANDLRVSDTRAAWRIWAMLMIAIGAIYLLMFNPYWVPGGDSELYIAVGRSWATGLRHTFNGQFVSISPPGWPLLMAAAMKISPTFGLLKLITIACMTFTMGFWYWFLIRFTSPKYSALLTLLCAIISHVYSLSFWMHSDAMFCLLATAAMVVACQINEGKPHLIWRILLLSLLCIGAQLVRWAGALQWITVGGVLMAGQSLPMLWRFGEWQKELAKFRTRQWTAVAVSFFITVGTFAILRHELHLTAQQAADAQDAGVTFDEQQAPRQRPSIFSTASNRASSPSPRKCPSVCAIRGNGSAGFFGRRCDSSAAGAEGNTEQPRLPDRLAHHRGTLRLRMDESETLPMDLAGGLRVLRVSRLNWPNPNARYLVPILPIILWGTIEEFELFARIIHE